MRLGKRTAVARTGVAVLGLTLLALRLKPWGRQLGELARAAVRGRIAELTALAERVELETEDAVRRYAPTSPVRIDDLSTPAAEWLRGLPGVQRVEVSAALAKPEQRIVPDADWHIVPRDLFAADM